ncbi:MAG: ACT domain-containing protein [Kangiellaceae bacterium]|jgi:hypothetical protein|nr:ACT domain-containing protein [Kangiellaceae bacterium]
MTDTSQILALLHDQTPMSIAQISQPVELPSSPNHIHTLITDKNEISLIAPDRFIQQYNDFVKEVSGGWQAIKINQQLDFDMVGIIASISHTLAEQEISIFVLSTYSTDVFLVKSAQLGKALLCLRKLGHNVETVNGFG